METNFCFMKQQCNVQLVELQKSVMKMKCYSALIFLYSLEGKVNIDKFYTFTVTIQVIFS